MKSQTADEGDRILTATIRSLMRGYPCVSCRRVARLLRREGRQGYEKLFHRTMKQEGLKVPGRAVRERSQQLGKLDATALRVTPQSRMDLRLPARPDQMPSTG